MLRTYVSLIGMMFFPLARSEVLMFFPSDSLEIDDVLPFWLAFLSDVLVDGSLGDLMLGSVSRSLVLMFSYSGSLGSPDVPVPRLALRH